MTRIYMKKIMTVAVLVFILQLQGMDEIKEHNEDPSASHEAIATSASSNSENLLIFLAQIEFQTAELLHTFINKYPPQKLEAVVDKIVENIFSQFNEIKTIPRDTAAVSLMNLMWEQNFKKNYDSEKQNQLKPKFEQYVSKMVSPEQLSAEQRIRTALNRAFKSFNIDPATIIVLFFDEDEPCVSDSILHFMRMWRGLGEPKNRDALNLNYIAYHEAAHHFDQSNQKIEQESKSCDKLACHRRAELRADRLAVEYLIHDKEYKAILSMLTYLLEITNLKGTRSYNDHPTYTEELLNIIQKLNELGFTIELSYEAKDLEQACSQIHCNSQLKTVIYLKKGTKIILYNAVPYILKLPINKQSSAEQKTSSSSSSNTSSPSTSSTTTTTSDRTADDKIIIDAVKRALRSFNIDPNSISITVEDVKDNFALSDTTKKTIIMPRGPCRKEEEVCALDYVAFHEAAHHYDQINQKIQQERLIWCLFYYGSFLNRLDILSNTYRQITKIKNYSLLLPPTLTKALESEIKCLEDGIQESDFYKLIGSLSPEQLQTMTNIYALAGFLYGKNWFNHIKLMERTHQGELQADKLAVQHLIDEKNYPAAIHHAIMCLENIAEGKERMSKFHPPYKAEYENIITALRELGYTLKFCHKSDVTQITLLYHDQIVFTTTSYSILNKEQSEQKTSLSSSSSTLTASSSTSSTTTTVAAGASLSTATAPSIFSPSTHSPNSSTWTEEDEQIYGPQNATTIQQTVPTSSTTTVVTTIAAIASIYAQKS